MDSACVLVLLLAASDQYASQGMVPDLLNFFLLTTSEEKELAISGLLDVFFGNGTPGPCPLWHTSYLVCVD